ncbi:MAG: right-handed parallel beta-helix repeat-containing protein [bacterium]
MRTIWRLGSPLVLAVLASVMGCGDSSSATVDASIPVDSGWGGDGGPPVCETPDASGFHATLDGTPDGDGSLAAPWDLVTALDRPPGVGPGDTIWIHAGRYIGTFVVKQHGLPGAPVTMRAWPGDRVTLDSAGATDQPVLQIYHEWMVIRDLEITNSGEDRRSDRATGIYVGGDHVALVNLVVHDVGTGISGGQLTADDTQEGTDILLYGSLFYNNGWLGTDRGHGHHTYLTNRDSVTRLEENVLFYAYGFGVHNYSYSDSNYVRNNEIIGNVWFLNGVPGGKLYDGCMVGHDGSHVVQDVQLRENFGWALSISDRDVRLGWDTPNENATLVDNYLVGQTIFQAGWTGVSMTGNTFIGPVEGVAPADYPDNTYLDAAPAQNHVVIRPNRYEPGRAHIIVYNWEGLDEVSLDLGDLVPPGTDFELRNAQDFFAAPVVTGTYDGSDVAVPLTGLDIALPIGDPDAIPANQRTGRDFNVFVLRAAVCD